MLFRKRFDVCQAPGILKIILTYHNVKFLLFVTKHLFISYTQKEAGFEQTINEKIITVPMTEQTKTLIKRLEKDLVIEGQNEIILADTPVKLIATTGNVKF